MDRFFEISAAFWTAGFAIWFDHTEEKFQVLNLETKKTHCETWEITEFINGESEETVEQIVAGYCRADNHEPDPDQEPDSDPAF